MIDGTLPSTPEIIKVFIVFIAVCSLTILYRSHPQGKGRMWNFLRLIGTAAQMSVLGIWTVRWMRSMWINSGKVEFYIHEYSVWVSYIELGFWVMALYFCVDNYLTLRRRVALE